MRHAIKTLLFGILLIQPALVFGQSACTVDQVIEASICLDQVEECNQSGGTNVEVCSIAQSQSCTDLISLCTGNTDPGPGPVQVPEPGTLLLFVIGLVALFVMRRRNQPARGEDNS